MGAPSTLNLKAAPWKMVSLAALKRDGRLHLPDLQRGFVWSAERVRALHDSLYRVVPGGGAAAVGADLGGARGAVLHARPGTSARPTRSPAGASPRRPVPIPPGSLFVLDGQQRLTSIFRVIFRSRIRNQHHARSRSAGGAVARGRVGGEPVSPALEQPAPPR